MHKRKKLIGNQGGMVLYSSLMMLAVMMAVGVQAIVSTQSNFQISANLTSENAAFYFSEAGIEWSKNELARSTVHPPEPLNANIKLASGAFSISTLSSVAASPMVAKAVVRSTGRFGSSSQVIQAELIKHYLLADAAIGLRGHSGGASFNGDLFAISGRDHDPITGKPVAFSRLRPGITVSQDELKDQLPSQLSPSQLANVTGTDRNGAKIATAEVLPSEAIARLGDDLCASANAQVTAVAGATAISLANQIWGSRSAPELRCIDGSSGPGDSVTLRGNSSGAGILVVRNTELMLDGTFRWEGLIMVTGSQVSFRALPSGNHEIFGAVIVNETYSGAHGPVLDLQGSVKVLFSRTALENAVILVSGGILTVAYASLPSEMTQSYWRLVTP